MVANVLVLLQGQNAILDRRVCRELGRLCRLHAIEFDKVANDLLDHTSLTSVDKIDNETRYSACRALLQFHILFLLDAIHHGLDRK